MRDLRVAVPSKLLWVGCFGIADLYCFSDVHCSRGWAYGFFFKKGKSMLEIRAQPAVV
jgi:hypothetical protein